MSQPLTHSAPFSWYHLRLADLFNLGSFALKSKNGLMKIPQYLNLGTSPKDLTWLHHVASILQLGGCLILNFEELKTRSLGSPSFFTFAFCLFSPICFANCALYSSLFYLAPCIKPRECISSGWCQFCKMMFDRGINGWRFFSSGASDDRTIPTDFHQTMFAGCKIRSPNETASSMAKPPSQAKCGRLGNQQWVKLWNTIQLVGNIQMQISNLLYFWDTVYIYIHIYIYSPLKIQIFSFSSAAMMSRCTPQLIRTLQA